MTVHPTTRPIVVDQFVTALQAILPSGKVDVLTTPLYFDMMRRFTTMSLRTRARDFEGGVTKLFPTVVMHDAPPAADVPRESRHVFPLLKRS